MDEKRVTLKDVAAKAGVSLMTVSYALRDSKQVSTATAARVRKIADQMGYQPDPMMTRLASYRTKQRRVASGVTLAWLNLHRSPQSWNFRGSHYLEAYEGAVRRAGNLGYQMDAFKVHALGGWNRVSEILRSRGIQGVIIGQPPANTDTADLDWPRFASVAIGRAIRTPDLPRVVINHVQAVGQLYEQLRGRGYRRIGLVMELGECVKNAYRNVSGYFGVCERLGIPAAERVPPLLPKTLSAKALKAWIEQWQVDGILVHRQDQMERMLPVLGLSVPRDIGFAHISMHAPIPGVTGFVFDPAGYGSWAVDLVHWLLDRGERGLPDPAPTLMLTSFRWAEGKTLRPPATAERPAKKKSRGRKLDSVSPSPPVARSPSPSSSKRRVRRKAG
ncbi:MAG: LacI family DNA-binding transcriptional regulator [Opitutales bacterium]|nr:LacI family DNA-binding transcriptional regulator [Opitutales bacterium]